MQYQDASLLLVDGDFINNKLLTEVLRLDGYRNIHSTIDPRNVPALCEEYEVDLIMLDINMPFKNGFDVMRELRHDNRQYEVPVIVISSQNDVTVIKRAFEEGVYDFFIKPFNHEELTTCVNNLLITQYLSRQNK